MYNIFNSLRLLCLMAIATITTSAQAADPAEVVATLSRLGLTVSTAESCTGGDIAHLITEVPGSSAAFKGGAVTYWSDAKVDVLGVEQAVIDTCGVVSAEVVRQMAQGACRVFHTDCAVATSGIAGPTGAEPGKPVGTVWIAVRTPEGSAEYLCHFDGDRRQIIDQAARTTLNLLLKHLDSTSAPSL